MKDKVKHSKKVKQKSGFVKAVNKIMPYILSVFAAFVLFSLSNLAGHFGGNIKAFLYGTFSNFATYFLPIFLIYHAIMWNYDVKKGICVRRVVCSIITLMCFSTMQYLIQVQDNASLNIYNIVELFTYGKGELGGGVVGGVIGKLLLEIGNIVGVIIITFVLLFMILQMFNITPAYMVRSMFKTKKKQPSKAKVEPKKVKKVRPIKPRRVEVYEDDDTVDVEIPAFINSTRIIDVDANLDNGADDGGFGENNNNNGNSQYEKLDVNVIKARTEHIPDQLKPYSNGIQKINTNTGADVNTNTNTNTNTNESLVEKQIFVSPVGGEEEAVVVNNVNVGGDNSGNNQTEEFTVTSTKLVKNEVDASVEIKKIELSPVNNDNKNSLLIDIDEINEYARRGRPVVSEETEENGVVYGGDSNEGEAIYIDVDENEVENEIEEAFNVTANPIVEKAITNTSVKVEEKKKPKTVIDYFLPPIYFLKTQPDNSNTADVRAELHENAKIIVDTLNDFKAPSRVVDITRGPTITRYELQPEKGVRVRTIEGLVDDIALNLAAKGIRIECPIPGKNAIGIEVPNRTISFVYLRDLIEDPKFGEAESKLTCALGKSISGENIYVDIESTPHLLVAGATGMGKSVCINSLLISLLYKAKPDDVRLILIDPKRVELSNYNGSPHLLVPGVCEPKQSLGALQWAVTEMEERFMAIEEAGVRNIKEFNQKVEKGYNAEKMARIVIVIDELADLKMAVPDIEGHITRLTQKARAAGIHIIIGTQRPSVDVLTGLIKNNIPSRIAFRVPSQVDSRTILDEVGAEKLVSKGDMLVKLVGALAPVRVQGAYVSVDEIEDVIKFWKESGPANYDEEVMQKIDNNAAKLAKNDKDVGEGDEDDDDGLDPEFYNALGLAVDAGKLSSSLLMRKLSLGFGRASRVIDQLEAHGYIGESNGPKPREVLISKEEYQEIMMRRNDQ